MRNKFLSILVCLLLVAPIFVGCSLYKKDDSKTASNVAIRVGDEVITREEIQNAYTTYYNYGYGYMYDQDQLMDMVIKSLVNQKLGLIVAKKIIVITEENFDEIIEKIEESLKGEIDERERAIYEKAGEIVPERICDDTNCDEPSHNHEEEETSSPYNPYESVVLTPTPENEIEITEQLKLSKISDFIAEFKTECKQYASRFTALNQYIAELVQVEEVKGNKVYKEQAFQNKIDEMVEYYMDQKYVEKLQEYVESRIEISDQEILEKFTELVNKEKQTYAGNTFADAYEDSQSKNMFLFYGYENIDEDGEFAENGYIRVQHLLIQYSDLVKADLAKLPGYGISEKEYRYHLGQQWLDTSTPEEPHTIENAKDYMWFPETDEDKNEVATFISQDEWLSYINIRNSYLNSLTTTYLDPETGKKVVDKAGVELTKTLEEVLQEINEVANWVAQNGESQAQLMARKAQEFRKLMYIYGSDEGMFQVGYTTEILGYSLPADQTKLSSEIGNNASGFVGEFVVAAYDLYNSSKLISDSAVLTDHGAHILLNLGKTNAGVVCENNIESMKDTLLSLSYGETVYDYVYSIILEEKTNSAYSDYLIEMKKELNNEIEYILSSYEEIF